MNEQKERPEVTGVFSALITGFGLDRKEVQLLVRVGWVVFVSTSLAYIFGVLAWLGVAAPYARAAEVSDIQQTVNLSARINLAQEIRLQVRGLCSVTDQNARDSIQRSIDNLQAAYSRLNNNNSYPEPGCPQK